MLTLLSHPYFHCSLRMLAFTSLQAASLYVSIEPKGPSKVLWHAASGGTFTMRLPPTVLFRPFQTDSFGQHDSPW